MQYSVFHKKDWNNLLKTNSGESIAATSRIIRGHYSFLFHFTNFTFLRKVYFLILIRVT